MEYGEGTFPPIGGVTHEQEQYDQHEEYGEWWSGQEEWKSSKPIGAVTKGKGNAETVIMEETIGGEGRQTCVCHTMKNEEVENEFKEVKNRKTKGKREYKKCHDMDKNIHQAKTYNKRHEMDRNIRQTKTYNTYDPLSQNEAPRKVVTRNIETTKEEMKTMMMATLTRMKESASINACGKITDDVKQGWTQMSLAVDSGACESVINPDDAPGHDVTESPEAMRGDNFASATGEPIPNLGIMNLPMVLRERSLRSMKLCAAPVTRPLASVKKICRAGHMVIFDDEGSYIYNNSSGEINMLREDDGNCMLDVWFHPKISNPLRR